MSKRGTVKQISIGLFVIVILIGLVLGSIWIVLHWLGDLTSNVDSAIIAASIAGFISIATVVLAKVWEARYKVKHELRLKKSGVYEEFVDFMIKKVLLGSPEEKLLIEKNTDKFFREYQSKLIIWGGERVVKKFVNWRTFGASLDESPRGYELTYKMFNSFDSIFLSMRKDLGHSNKGLKELDITRMFVNNLDRDLEAMKKNR